MGVSKEKWNKERFTQNLELNQFSCLSWPYCALDTLSYTEMRVEELEESGGTIGLFTRGVVAAVKRERCWERMVLRQTPEERRQTQTWKRNQLEGEAFQVVFYHLGLE